MRQAASPTSNLINADSRPLFLVDEDAFPLLSMIDLFRLDFVAAVWVDRESYELFLFLYFSTLVSVIILLASTVTATGAKEGLNTTVRFKIVKFVSPAAGSSTSTVGTVLYSFSKIQKPITLAI